MIRTPSFREWLASGSPWMWLTAGAVSLSLVMVFGLLVLIAGHGLAHFWPARLAQIELVPGHAPVERLLGELTDSETVAASRVRDAGGPVPPAATVIERLLVKVGNRDLLGDDFRWVAAPGIA